MGQFSKRDARVHPAARPSFSRDEFVAPAGAPRPRGSSAGPRDPAPPAARPAPARPAAPGPSSAAAAPREPAPATPPGSRSGPARDELKLCGLAAVRARFARDPQSILRLFFDHATGQRVGVMCKVLASAKRVYRQVEPAELEKIAGSIHHGGIVAVVAPAPLRPVTTDELARWAKRAEPVLVLDRIGNAHNLGAIVRTAAFFGVPRIVIPEHADAARPSDAAHRVAEGGFEHVEVWLARDLVALARDLAAAGFDVVGAATRGGRADAARPRDRRPLALLLGNEEHGLAPEVATACTRLVTIPGSGQVESLNVSVAAAVLLWELAARRPAAAPAQ
jgi:TrmH RNA methyltransferase